MQPSHFVLMGDVRYKKGFSHLYLKCLVPDEADYFMKEAHEGVYGNHSGVWSLVHKLI